MGMIVETTCSKCDFNVETMDNSVFESSGYHHNIYYCLNCQDKVKIITKGYNLKQEKCPICNSYSAFLEVEDNISCPKCKNGILKSEVKIFFD